MILHFVNLYRASVLEAKSDVSGNASELALHYKVEIAKYIFLLAINVTECIGLVAYEASVLATSLYSNFDIFGNCTTGDVHNTEFPLIILNPIGGVLESIGSIGFVGLLFSFSLVICLMKYLDTTYHDINGKLMPVIKYILSLSCFIGIALIVAGFVPQLFLLQILSEPVINLFLFLL